MSEEKRKPILKIRDLSISFKTEDGTVRAVRGVNFDLYKGETVALVGESGCGKSVSVKAIMGTYAPPLTAPPAFAGRQTRGDSKGCCRPVLLFRKGEFP